MKEVHIILTLPKQKEEAEVNVLNEEPGPKNLLTPHVQVSATVPEVLWKVLVEGDELDAVAQAAFELGRKFERGEYDSFIQ